FFQAEDGIRDFHVTGVQTCALPIYTIDAATPKGTSPAKAIATNTIESSGTDTALDDSTRPHCARSPKRSTHRWYTSVSTSSATRSEERRVGKQRRVRCPREEHHK